MTINVGGVNVQSATTYTLQASDNFQCVALNNAAAVTVTLPNNLPVGFNCMVYQAGAGQVTLSPAAGAVMLNRSNYTKIAGQQGVVSLFVVTNGSGTSANYVLAGDGAP